MVKSLPDYAWRTKRLPEKVLAVREAFYQARSPEKLLFYDLPQAFGPMPFTGSGDDLSDVESFFNDLNEVLQEWSKATSSIIEWALDKLLNSCGMQSGVVGWNQLRLNAARLEETVTHPRLLPFLKRIGMDDDEKTVIESVLAFVADRPPRSWSDSDVDRFPSRANNIGQLFTQAMRVDLVSDNRYPQELSPDEYRQSQLILGSIKELVNREFGDTASNRILRAAIMNLLWELETKSE
jgi:hypothetical protein